MTLSFKKNNNKNKKKNKKLKISLVFNFKNFPSVCLSCLPVCHSAAVCCVCLWDGDYIAILAAVCSSAKHCKVNITLNYFDNFRNFFMNKHSFLVKFAKEKQPTLQQYKIIGYRWLHSTVHYTLLYKVSSILNIYCTNNIREKYKQIFFFNFFFFFCTTAHIQLSLLLIFLNFNLFFVFVFIFIFLLFLFHLLLK